MRFKDYLQEAVGDTVGIMFGRFNPPHKGHKAAWEMASENDQWFVGTNKSTQGKKDPLPYDVKIKAMEALWPSVGPHIVPETNLFTLASKVYKELGEVNLVVYTDEEWLLKGLEKYNGVEGKHGYFKFNNISNKPTPRLSSATDVRNAVLADDREAFERAAGVSADYKIDGKDYFDLVAEYLLPHHAKESKSDKYNEQGNLKESQMDINTLRKLAGLPVEEAAPVSYSKKPGYEMSDTERKLADIGRLLMQMAETEKDDALSNAISSLGNALASGDISDQAGLISFIKTTDVDPAALSDRTTKAIAAYNKGERADIGYDSAAARDIDPDKGPGLSSHRTVDVDVDSDSGMRTDFNKYKEAVDLSDIRADYGIDEADDGGDFLNDMLASFEDMCSQQGYYGDVDAEAVKRQLDAGHHEAAAEEMASAISDRNGGEAPDEVYQQALEMVQDYMAEHGDMGAEMARYESEEDAMDYADSEYDDEEMGGEVDFDDEYDDEGESEIASRRDRMRKAKAAGGKYATQEAVEETAQNAMDAAMAELRKLAGL